MLKKVQFVIILIICIINSCSNSDNNYSDFTEESFKNNIHLKDGIKYMNERLLLGNPSYLRYHPDSFLIIQDKVIPKLVKIIDLKNNKIQELIEQGRGPGEMLAPFGIDILGNEVFLFCLQLRKLIKLTPDQNRQFQISDEYILDEKTSYYRVLKKDLLVCTSSIGDDKRLTFLNGKGKLIRKTGDYPPFESIKEIKGDNDIFSSFIASTPDGNKFVLACNRTDVIEIYDTYKGLIKRFQGPIGIRQTISYESVGGIGYSIHREPSYLTYGHVRANKNEFWVSYVGYKFDKNIQPTINNTYPKRIFCFDWDGNPLRVIEFNFNIHSFDVDWIGKVLYSLEWQNGNPEIVTYSLKNILR